MFRLEKKPGEDFIVLNLFLFRSLIFKKKKKKDASSETAEK